MNGQPEVLRKEAQNSARFYRKLTLRSLAVDPYRTSTLDLSRVSRKISRLRAWARFGPVPILLINVLETSLSPRPYLVCTVESLTCHCYLFVALASAGTSACCTMCVYILGHVAVVVRLAAPRILVTNTCSTAAAFSHDLSDAPH